MNKPLAALVGAAMLVSVAGCAAGDPGADSGDEGLKVVVVENQPPGDKGSIDMIISGAHRGADELGWESAEDAYVSDPSQVDATLRKFADAGYDLIVTTFPPMTQPTIDVANAYPDVHFVNVGGEFVPEDQIPENMAMYNGLEGQGSFLAGALAAKMSKTGKIAMMTGPTVDINLRWESGLVQGALWANPDIEYGLTVTKSYSDPVDGKSLAENVFSSGVDVILTASAGTDLGIHEAAESDPQNRHTITLDSQDIKSVAPNAGLAAITVRYDNWVYKAMQSVTDDAFVTGYVYVSLADDAWTISQWGDGVPANIQGEIEDLKDQIVAGDVEVVATWPDDKDKLAELKKEHGYK